MSERACAACRNLLLEGETACAVCGAAVEVAQVAAVPAAPRVGPVAPSAASLQTDAGPAVPASHETDASGAVPAPRPGPPRPSVRMRASVEPAARSEGALPAELATRFSVLRLLGKGGMGAVSLCLDRQLNREVAIKVVLQRSEKLEQLLLQEAQVLASLEHENIVRLYDLGTAGGLPYLVMEYVRGRTLAARLAAGPVSVLYAVRFARDIVTGVKAAHERGVVHFDIKPGNIFLDEGGRAKVADFGLAQFARGGGEKEGLFYFVGGTPAYMPPEQRYGAAGKPADVYACAAVLHEMLTGRPTFPGRSEDELRVLKEQTAIPRPSGVNPRVPAALDEIVVAALDRDPMARPTTEEFLKVLEEWLDRVGRQTQRAAGAVYPVHPYRFLEWFEVADAPIFFGRDAETAELTELVGRPAVRAVSVFGPCGIGKSSVLRAGLARAVDPTAWGLEIVLGGPAPAGRVREALCGAAARAGIAADADALEREPRLVNALVAELARVTGKGLVLVLDQTEEVFTQNPADSPAPAELFALLAELAEDTRLALKLVVAYRTEFRGDFFPLEQRLGPRMASFPLAEIQEAGLVEAIEGPSTIEAYGFSYEPGLAAKLAREILASARANRTSALPTLSIVCRQLWERLRENKARVITWELYESELGGARGALERYVQERLADPVYAHAGALARQILEALTIKDGERERFACARDEAEVLDFPDQRQAMQTLEQLIRDRLVVRDVQDGRRTLRLTSEVICPTIDAWAAAPDPAQLAARELARAHRVWVEHARAAEYLLSGRQVAQVRAQLPALRGVSEDEHRFVERSVARARAGAAARLAVALVVLALSGGWGWSSFFRPGRLKLDSRPSGARVTFEGREIGTTPLTWERRPGVYALQLSKADHDPQVATVQVRPGGETVTTENLAYTRGLLQIVTDPPGATCAILGGGGRAVLRSPVSTEVPRGAYAVTVSLAGYETRVVGGVQVEGDRQLTHRLVKLARETGSVVARACREGTRLVLAEAGGRVVLEETLPLRAPAQLPAGQYTAECGTAQGRVDFLSVKVSARTTVELSPWVPAVAAAWTVRGVRPTNPAGLADLDGDGAADLVLGTADGFVRALSGRTGHELWHFRTEGAVQCTPALVDLDGDGVADAVVTSHDGRTYAISGRTGELLWSHAARDSAQVNPAVGDLDGDGVPDVVVGSADGRVTALKGADGAELWSVATGGPVFADPRLVDVNGDGHPDVVVGSNDRVLRAIDGKTGAILWTHTFGGVIGGAAMLAPLDGDAVPDAVVIAGDHRLSAVSGATGKLLWTAEGTVDGVAEPIGDIDGDGVPDGVCVTASYEALRAFSGKTGRWLWTLPVASHLWPMPVVVDLHGETGVVVASPAQVWVVSARDGRPLWGLRPGGVMTAPPTVADIDGDGTADLVPVMADVLIAVSGTLGDHRWAGVTAGVVATRPVLQVAKAGPPLVIAASQDRGVRAYDAASGAPRWTFDAGAPVIAGPALADLDGDGLADVVIATSDGRLAAISGRGDRRLWERDPGGLVEALPLLADVDGDGVADALVGTSEKTVAALSGRDGHVLWTAPVSAPVNGALAQADIGGVPAVVATTADGRVHALAAATGHALWSAPVGAGGFACGAVVADLDGDGAADVLVGGADGVVRALAGRTGRQLWSWRAGGAVRAGPALRARADGPPDVVVGTADGWVQALSGRDGALRWTRKMGEGTLAAEAPLCADLDGDGVADVLCACGGELVALEGETGRPLAHTAERFVEAQHPLLVRRQRGLDVVYAATSAVVARAWRAPVKAAGGARVSAAGGGRLWAVATGAAITASAAVGALGGERAAVVVGSLDGRVYAVGADGKRLWTRTLGSPCGASPALGDLTHAGKLDVVVGTSGGRVVALDGATGATRWDVDAGSAVVASPLVTACASGPDGMRVIVGTRGGRLLALDAGGSVKWSVDGGAAIVASPGAGDLDGDGLADVVVGADDGSVRALRGSDGHLLWSVAVSRRVRSSPVVVPGATGALVVLGAGDKRVVALSGRDGALVWAVETGGETDGSPAVGDVDGDGALEVVIGGGDGVVRALRAATGAVLWSQRAGPRVLGRPAIGDIDGNGHAEVVVGSADGELYVLDGTTGRRLRAQGCESGVEWSSPALFDLDGDGTLDLVVGSQAGTIAAFSGGKARGRARAESVWSFTSGRIFRK